MELPLVFVTDGFREIGHLAAFGFGRIDLGLLGSRHTGLTDCRARVIGSDPLSGNGHDTDDSRHDGALRQTGA